MHSMGIVFSPKSLRVKFTSLDVFTLCFSEKLPAAGNLALHSEGNAAPYLAF